MVVKITETNLSAYKKLFQEAFNYLKDKNLLREIDNNLTTFTTLEHYFSYIEILKHNPHFLLNTPISDSFIVDPNSKIIKAPVSFSNHTIIQTDSGVDMITFKIDRFFSSIDLANARAFVQWTAPDENGVSQREYASSCQIDLLDDANMIKIGWIIDNDITKYPGDLSFALTFFIKDPNNLENDIIRLNTQPIKITIKPALHSEVGLNWSDPFDKVESAIVNNKYTGKMPYPQSPKFSGAGYDLPSEANLVQDTLTLKAQAYVTDLGVIDYQWRFTPLGEERPLKCALEESDRSFICKPTDYISETVYNFLTPTSQEYFELIKIDNEYKYRLINADNTKVYYKMIGNLGVSFEKVNVKNFKPTAGEEYYKPNASDLEKETIEMEIFYKENAKISETEFQEIDFIKVEDTYISKDKISIGDYFSAILDDQGNKKGYLVIKRNGINVKIEKEDQYKKIYYNVDNNKFTPILGEDITKDMENIYEKFSTFTIPKSLSENDRKKEYKQDALIKYNEYNQIKYIYREDGTKVEKEDLAADYFEEETEVKNPVNDQEMIITQYKVKKDVWVLLKEEDVVGSYQVFAKNTVILSYPTNEIDPTTGEVVYEQLTNSSFEQGSYICRLLGPDEVELKEKFQDIVFIQNEYTFGPKDYISLDDYELIIDEKDKEYFSTVVTEGKGYLFTASSPETISLRKINLETETKQNDRDTVFYSWKYSDKNPINSPIETSYTNDSKSLLQTITEPGWYKMVAVSKRNRKEISTETKICKALIPKKKIPAPTLTLDKVIIDTKEQTFPPNLEEYHFAVSGAATVTLSFKASILGYDDYDPALVSDGFSYSLKRFVLDSGSPEIQTSDNGEFTITFEKDPSESNSGLGERYFCAVKNILNEEKSNDSNGISIYFT